MAATRNWLDFLKLRIGWGISGNDRIGNYNIFSTYAASQFNAGYGIDGGRHARIGFMPTELGNPDVTWETTETQNFGVDATMLNGSTTFSFDLWQRYTSDMLYRLRMPATYGGATPPFMNIGEMKNTGFDFELGYNNTALDGRFRYRISANISRYVNEIVRLSPDVEEEIIFPEIRQQYYTRASAGTSFPEFYGYIVDGIFQNQQEADAHPTAFGEAGTYNRPGRYIFRDLNGDGIITEADRTYIGNPHPDFTGGLNIDLQYNNIGLNMFFYGSYGNDMINQTLHYINYGLHESNLSKDVLYRSWGSPYLENNENAVLPIFDRNEQTPVPSTARVEDGSFLRFQNLRVTYSIPQNLLTRMQMQNIIVYGQITNLFTLTNYSGLDPDLHHRGGQMGVDEGAWPTPRSLMIGITLDF